MADKSTRYSQNTEGPFYVDENCIACDACVVEAPDFFQMNNDEGHAFVFRQPESENDFKNCIEALDSCPVDAIGKDG